MDDSDQDFVDVCSKQLKRVRKKPGEPRQPRKAEPSSQASDGDKRRRNNRRDGDSGSKCAGTQPVGTGAEQKHGLCGGTGHDSGDARSTVVHAAAAGPRGLAAKDKVLRRMQQFKRAGPQKMVREDKSQPADHEGDCVPPPPLAQRRDPPESSSSALHPGPQDSDEALAMRLQQELDREAAEAQAVDLEDRGLFFCQICHRDLSHMASEGRTQHLNRCLDESEESAPAPPPPPPPPPGVPDCPICGKKFKSRKSRSTHLKRCSSDMGVSPAVLLQAVQRQAEETQNVPTANAPTQTGGTKRKGPSKPGLPASKKPRKKTDPVDEDTLVALALSSSLLEQEREQYREGGAERRLQTEPAASRVSMTPVLKWRPDAGKGRGNRKRGAAPRPPPLLLVQDAEAALTRLQERVSALLPRSRAPSPPTPTRRPSSLPGWSGAAPLWRKSALPDGGAACPSDFYTPELREFITPWESAPTAASATTSSIIKPESSVRPVSEGAPLTGTRTSIPPSSSSSPAPSTPGTGQLPVGSQALRELMELAEDGVTLTQCGYTTTGPDKDNSQTPNLHLSGFVPEEPADPRVSGFLPEAARARSEDTRDRARRTSAQPGADHRPWALPRLQSDLSSMVNNPQLSDMQLQVDNGEVYFAHSFMVYARCPLLAEMVHESGFKAEEEGMPAAQRVLMSDVPGQAVFALLQYLYTAHCFVTASLLPYVLELASRFDLRELQQLCELQREDAAARGDEEDYVSGEESVNKQTDQAFTDLLRSMWVEEDEDNNEGADTDGGSDEERGLEKDHQADELPSGDGEIREEKVNEDELEEIYEFAATQRKREEEEEEEEEQDSMEENEAVDKEDDGEGFTKLTEPRRSSTGFSVKQLQPNSHLEPDPVLDRLFSDSWGVYEGGEPSSLPPTPGPANTHDPRSPHKPSSERSGRTLLHSSASVVDDLSLNPPPSTSNLPVTGQSPDQVGDQGGGGGDKGTDAVELDLPKEGLPLKRGSKGPRSVRVPLPSDSPQRKEEPELIVLSDSSEETEVVLSSCSPSPQSPCAVQNLQSYTRINPQPPLKPDEPTLGNKESRCLEFSPDDPVHGPADCSPEVSWLIPSTPLQPRRTTTSSTQTKSSMRRTQLFPQGDTSPPSLFSSPPSPFDDRLQTSNSPTRVSTTGPTEGSVPGLKLDKKVPCSSSVCPERTSSCDASKDRVACSVPPCRPKPSSTTSSRQETPRYIQPRPYSSTPLHTELLQPAVLLGTSPLHSSFDKQRLTSQGRDRKPSESPEKTELGSFHLSPLSDPSDSLSSSSRRGLRSPRRHSESSRQRRRSVGSSGDNNNTGGELERRGVRNEKGDGETECADDDDGEQEEAEGADFSFRQSFMDMDEPPIAFNDSWGLDACADANPGCFSLRLEDSLQERSPGRRDTARLSPSTDRQPPPPSPCVQSSTQPSASVRAPTGPSFTPPPPDPAVRTTPETNNSLPDSIIWDSWEEEEDDEALPLSWRVNPPAQHKTPASSHNKRRRTLVPITPLPHYSDMDTPELKNKLNRFGVRPLPKRQMILKLKEIHQYTHQLVGSDSEDEAPSAGRAAQAGPPRATSVAAGDRPVSCAQTVRFKEPAAASPRKHNTEEEAELLSASQGSNTSTAASEQSERSNPELCASSDGDSDSDGGISASQAATRLQDRLRAVRSFILSDSGLYSQILQYQPLVLSQFQERLKAAGIRLGVAKLVDYLDSQCITFTTAKPSHSAPSRRRCKRAKTAGESGASRKRGVTVTH